MEKNKLLKVSAILLIVFGVLLAILAIIFFAAGDLVVGMLGQTESGLTEEELAILRLAVIIMAIAYLIDAAAYLAAGIIGVKQKSAKACLIFAIVLVVVCTISVIMNITQGSWTALLSLIVPILYLVGAIQLKKSADAAKADAEAADAADTTTQE